MLYLAELHSVPASAPYLLRWVLRGPAYTAGSVLAQDGPLAGLVGPLYAEVDNVDKDCLYRAVGEDT